MSDDLEPYDVESDEQDGDTVGVCCGDCEDRSDTEGSRSILFQGHGDVWHWLDRPTGDCES